MSGLIRFVGEISTRRQHSKTCRENLWVKFREFQRKNGFNFGILWLVYTAEEEERVRHEWGTRLARDISPR